MKGIKTVLAVSAVSLFLGTTAYAAEMGSGSEHRHESGSASSMSATDLKGEHSMSGKITDIDRDTGKVTLKTGAGDLDLHFPPQSLANLDKGDSITVHLGFTESAMGGAEAPRGGGAATGTVPSERQER
jgi:hypothetical protein